MINSFKMRISADHDGADYLLLILCNESYMFISIDYDNVNFISNIDFE